MATECIVAMYLPVVPLKSQHIIPTGNDKRYFVYSSSGYQIISTTKPSLKQVLFVYGVFVPFLAVWAIFAAWPDVGTSTPALLVVSLILAVVLFLPFLLRRRAIDRLRATYRAPSAETCPRCGNTLITEQSAFCTKCGSRLGLQSTG